MERSEERLWLVMDESDMPYKEGEYTRTLENDLIALRVAKEIGLKFKPESYFGKLSQIRNDVDLVRFAKEHGVGFEPGSYLAELAQMMDNDT